jgi:mevalonate kinase
MSITVSAPGKLMLFGEHAVVYGKPCIVTSVNQRLSIKAQKQDEPVFVLNAPDVEIKNYSKLMTHLGEGEIPKGAQFVEFATKNFFNTVIPAKAGIQANPTGSQIKSGMTGGVRLETVTQFKSTFGFGSSSASAVCTIKALSEIFEMKLSEKEIFKLAYKTVLDVQGLGSGFDLAAAIYGGTLYFVTGGKKIEPLQVDQLPLIVGYTGVKADTATIVKEVKARFENKQAELKKTYAGIEVIVENAKKAFVKKDLKKLGELMNANQKYLEELGVSTNKLSSMINAARNAGAYGAKLSGAGGGDCMIALAPTNDISAVKKAIQNAGGKVLEVKVNTEGVKLEK